MIAESLPKILLLIVVCNLAGSGQSESQSATGIEGVIMISPVPPRMTKAAHSGETPLVNAPFAVANERGERVTSFRTDERGRFRVLVAAGRYTVSQADNKSQIRRCGPWSVDVTAAQMSRVQWYCEIGGAPLSTMY